MFSQAHVNCVHSSPMSRAQGRPTTNAAFFLSYDPDHMGRRHVQDAPKYTSSDFLKDPTLESRPADRGLVTSFASLAICNSSAQTAPLTLMLPSQGVPDVRSSKFGPGFSRRPQSQIKQDVERKALEVEQVCMFLATTTTTHRSAAALTHADVALQEKRKEVTMQHKREVRAAINGNHGNVMIGGDAITEPV